ncbi:MAG TPA: hypothetical protein VIW92_11860, partial [Thermoanaerobaculia bacterium]
VSAVQKVPGPAERPAAPHVRAAQPGGIQARPAPVRPLPPRPEQPAKIVQRLPSNNNDPTGNADGIYWDRQDMVSVNGKNVPSRLTAVMKKPPDGGRPSVSPPGWDWLQTKVQKLKGNWVRFHIINQKLGGPGNRTWNLVPTSVAVNNTFNREIEEPAKTSANTNDHWTYVDVALQYDNGWPAPIPKKINAEWGDWDAATSRWVRRKALPSALDNTDITALGDTVYRRGINIRMRDLQDRGVPSTERANFIDWLRDYYQADDDIDDFEREARRRFGDDVDDGWLNAIYLDEDSDHPGRYIPVVKAL